MVENMTPSRQRETQNAKQKELTDKLLVKAQYRVNRHLRDALARVKLEADRSIEWAKDKGFTPNKALIRISEDAGRELTWLDIQGAKIDNLKKGFLPPDQETLFDDES